MRGKESITAKSIEIVLTNHLSVELMIQNPAGIKNKHSETMKFTFIISGKTIIDK
ncbi:hypothetical protein PSE10B_56940 [Pseudomonas amygdali pv. eriobotryae]|jgi:hypothetical protein|nr:hypothetical protein PSE10B_56940 [Pseudomonas amygdali pv. eriobotryae]